MAITIRKDHNIEAQGFMTSAKRVDSPKSFFGFLGSCCATLVTSVLFLIFGGFIVALSISKIVIGVLHVHDCPVQPMIPVWLIVCGVFAVGKLVVACCCKASKKFDLDDKGKDEGDSANVRCKSVDALFFWLALVWLMFGVYWVFSIRTTVNHENERDVNRYCDGLTYQFTFWVIVIELVVAGVVLIVMCCCGCVIAVCSRCCKGNTDEDQQEAHLETQVSVKSDTITGLKGRTSK